MSNCHTLWLCMYVLCVQYKHVWAQKGSTMITDSFIKSEISPPFWETYVQNESLSFDQLTSAYFKSTVSAIRCARRCISDKNCSAFDVRRDVKVGLTEMCALLRKKV